MEPQAAGATVPGRPQEAEGGVTASPPRYLEWGPGERGDYWQVSKQRFQDGGRPEAVRGSRGCGPGFAGLPAWWAVHPGEGVGPGQVEEEPGGDLPGAVLGRGRTTAQLPAPTPRSGGESRHSGGPLHGRTKGAFNPGPSGQHVPVTTWPGGHSRTPTLPEAKHGPSWCAGRWEEPLLGKPQMAQSPVLFLE